MKDELSKYLSSGIISAIEEKVGEIKTVTILENVSYTVETKLVFIVNEKIEVTFKSQCQKTENYEHTFVCKFDVNLELRRVLLKDGKDVFYQTNSRRATASGVRWRIAALTSNIEDDQTAISLLKKINEIAETTKGMLLEKEDLEIVLGKNIFEKLFFINESEYDLFVEFLTK